VSWLTGYGVYRPERRLTGAEIAERADIPERVVTEKMGVAEKRVTGPEEHVTDMCVAAAETALADAGLDAADLDLLLYHGSEYKDHLVWSAAADVAERLGAENAYATESHTLCASTPVAMRQTRAQLRTGDIERALHVTASREPELLDYTDPDASFMFNFGAGGAAYVLEAGGEGATGGQPGEPGGSEGREAGVSGAAPEGALARVRESSALTDGSFAHDVVMPAGGSVEPPSEESVAAGRHTLTVPDPEAMKERMASVSGPNFERVADEALARSGSDRSDVDFLALTHMKRSFTESLYDTVGVDASERYYLEEYGHVQSADQWLALDEGRELGRVEPGDVVLFLAAGTGYTWAATVLEWQG
jgi:3-oxoacyl-[acyl-carrier-protein] synthase-3